MSEEYWRQKAAENENYYQAELVNHAKTKTELRQVQAEKRKLEETLTEVRVALMHQE